jgi:chitin synthase
MTRLADSPRRRITQWWRHFRNVGVIIHRSRRDPWTEQAFPSFTVNHFNGAVTYSSEGFLDRNLDAVNPDFVSLLRGAADGLTGTGSINPFVKGLFSAKAIATQAHPRNEDTIVAAQQAVKPMRAPSTRRKSGIKRMPTVREGEVEEKDREEDETPGPSGLPSNYSPCVAGEFKAALDTLFETIDETHPWYVFCINPNDSQLPNQLEGRSVKGTGEGVGYDRDCKEMRECFRSGNDTDELGEGFGVEAEDGSAKIPGEL